MANTRNSNTLILLAWTSKSCAGIVMMFDNECMTCQRRNGADPQRNKERNNPETNILYEPEVFETPDRSASGEPRMHGRCQGYFFQSA